MVRSGTARKRTQRNTKTITVKGSEHKGSATLFFMVFKMRPKKPCPTRAPLPHAPLVTHGGRARCPHRAAAPRRGARLCHTRAPTHPVATRTSRAPLSYLPPLHPLNSRRHYTRHYSGGAIGTSRPTAITPSHIRCQYARELRTARALARTSWCAPPVPRCRAHRPCPVAVGRDVPIAPPCHRRGARLCHPHPARRATARRGSPPLCSYTSRANALCAPLCKKTRSITHAITRAAR